MAVAERRGPCIEPFFVAGTAGRLFWTLFKPSRAADSGDACVILPPFAEEMNKSRRMLALQARRLAERGWTVLLPDLYGTGDSAGEFSEATVAVWLEDARLMLSFLAERGTSRLNLLGVRMGSLLCASLLEHLPAGLMAGSVALWQPYTSGSVLVREFLRLRVAADMARNQSSSTASLTEEAQREGSVEVAGYSLSYSLMQELSDLRIAGAPFADNCRIGWLEVSMSETPGLRGGSRRTIAGLREQGLDISEMAVRCPPFWSSTEIVESDPVLDETTAFFFKGTENVGG